MILDRYINSSVLEYGVDVLAFGVVIVTAVGPSSIVDLLSGINDTPSLLSSEGGFTQLYSSLDATPDLFA